MTQEELDKYFAKSDIETKVRVLNSPEDIAEAERFNKRMRKVVREYRYRAALSRQLARGFCFTR